MESLWDDTAAAAFESDLGRRVYTSRLLGREPDLVLHGGGNTSVKVTGQDLFKRPVEILYIKGSGHDLATIDEDGFAPVRLRDLLELATLEELSDTEMARQLRIATVDPLAPAPSVEAILHAIIPFRFVDHTHPDALISVMNTPGGRRRVDEIYGDSVVVVDYVMPGFILARRCVQAWADAASRGVVGMVLMHHGLVTFDDDARTSYERTIELVDRAEAYLAKHGAWDVPADSSRPAADGIPELRKRISTAAGRPVIVRQSQDPHVTAFARRPDLASIATRGPATPDHVMRTKRLPLVGRDVDAYAREYRAYFDEHAGDGSSLQMLDQAPRVVLDPDLGGLTAGATPSDAAAVGDIYEHTVRIVERAAALEDWQALPSGDIFDVEYWDLEQAKLKRAGPPAPLAGEIALVTGAASGIGRACAEAFLAAGAAVVALDRDAAVQEPAHGPAYLGLTCDVTDRDGVAASLESAVRAFGGLDMLVLNAGVFPAGAPVASLDPDQWRSVIAVNLDSALTVLQAAHPLLRESPRGGRVVVNGSKNVPAPGPGAAAYSASKAALTQLARVTALEWGADGIRVNVVHPNAVFDTGLWTPEVLESRAASYGLTVDEYRRNNVLGAEVSSHDVARLIVAMCGDAFARTTGAQVPVDGGNERVI